MSPATRCLAVALLAFAATLTLAAPEAGARQLASADAPTIALQTPFAGRDFASTVFHDPWDYSDPSDANLDTGPALRLGHPLMSGGGLSFTVPHNGGYLSPMWQGYNSEVPTGREGALAANMINTGIYTNLHLHIYASSFTSAALRWSTCVTMTGCTGTMPFALHTGWNDIDQPIVRSNPAGRAWAGLIPGLRFALTAERPSAAIRLDNLRLYQASAASAITWSAPGTLWWTDSTGPVITTASQHAGPVATSTSSTRVNTNVAGYPPNTYFWSVGTNGRKTLVGRTAAAPLPIIDRPTATGCGDYATRYLGHPWTFTSARSLAGHANTGALSFTPAGELSATNAGPHRNDPNVTLPIARGGINGRVYHRLSIVESYDGPFGLANAPGGGAMARVLWQSSGHAALSQTAPLVTYTGKRALTVDMAMPASRLTDRSGTAAQRYAFASTKPVTKLRYDPNEDPGARRWHLFSVRLAADCHAALRSTVAWHDAKYTPGSTVRITARTAAGRSYPLGTTAERAGLNSDLVSVRSLPANKYSVCIYVTNSSGVTVGTHSSGPLVIT